MVKGNVEIYGTVTEITFGKGAGTVTTYATGECRYAEKAIELIAQGKCARIVLTADIDLKGSADNPWTPIDTEGKGFVEFDGAGIRSRTSTLTTPQVNLMVKALTTEVSSMCFRAT